MTHFHSVPDSGDGIVILTNSERSWPMIAEILGDWSDWNDIPPVGMTWIGRAATVLWIVIGVVSVVSLAQLWRIGSGLIAGRRKIAPLSRHSRALRLTQGLLSAFLLSAITLSLVQGVWALFVTPVFPRISTWLAASIVALTIVLLLSAMTPASGD